MQPLNWLVRLVVYGLAVFRVTNLFVNEDGPRDIFDWIRAKAGIYYVEKEVKGHFVMNESAETWQYVQPDVEWKLVAEGFWAKLLSCPLCLSVWFSFVAAIAAWLDNIYCDIVATWLAIAGVSLFLFRDNAEEDE